MASLLVFKMLCNHHDKTFNGKRIIIAIILLNSSIMLPLRSYVPGVLYAQNYAGRICQGLLVMLGQAQYIVSNCTHTVVGRGEFRFSWLIPGLLSCLVDGLVVLSQKIDQHSELLK